jgi:ribosomal protein L29|tara:strand:+ start:2733 stop:3122 length:390 start_codon:yes stop_codon:yes gene_type:complete
MKRLYKIGVFFAAVMFLTTAEAKPQKGKGKPHAEKIDKGKVKERLKAAAEKRKKHIESKKRGNGRPKLFGKGLENEKINELREKIKELHKEMHELRKKHREEMKKRMIEIKKEFANKRDKVIDGNKPGE